VRRHQCFDTAFDLTQEGVKIGFAFGKIALVVRQGVVRITAHPAVTGVVFADSRHAKFVQTAPQGIGKDSDDGRIGVKGTVANNRRDRVDKIENRGKAEVNVVLTQLIGDNGSRCLSQLAGKQRPVVETVAKGSRSGNSGKSYPEALYTPAFVINTQ
jgi:hypothetical protein